MNAAANLQELLRRLFRLDEPSDLDFGIYRAINCKREKMSAYVDNQLPQKIANILEQSREEVSEAKLAELARAREKALEVLGPQGLDADGNLADSAYEKIPAGANYLRAQADAVQMKNAAEMEQEIYGHLAAFLARYECGGGDIIPRRIHSVRGRYTVPHGGEEVLLHWANRNQYYIKSATHHSVVAFKSDGKRFKFQITEVRDIPRDNNMDTGRFLIPEIAQAAPDQNGDIVIPFAFRALNNAEQKHYTKVASGENGNGNKIQRGILIEELDKLKKAASKNPALAPLLDTNTGGDESSFMRHARRFVRRNTADFFIHRNLRKFLAEELDLYLKSEVLNAKELAGLGGFAIASRIVVFRAARELGKDIIDVLAEWEDLQKALWEKKKFVLQTEYCIAVGRIPDAKKSGILDDIAKCEKQWAEWEKMGVNGEAAALFSGKGKHEQRIAYLRETLSLPVDTANFPPEFKDRLLDSFKGKDGIPGIDDATDGVLIHGENWQTLNLLQKMYRGRVKCIYIDPPYNTGPSEILYKNDLKHSSWLALMENRLALSAPFLSEDGLAEVAIDDAELDGLLFLMKSVFGAENHVGTVTVMHNPRGRADALHLSPAHEYLVFYAKNYEQLETNQLLQSEEEIAKKYPLRDEISRYRELPFRRSGSNSARSDRPNMFYSIFFNLKTRELTLVRKNKSDIEIKPVDSHNAERVWRWGREKFEELAKTEFVVKKTGDGECTIYAKDREKIDIKPKTVWYGPRFDASSHGSMLIKSLFRDMVFDYPKSIHAVMDAVQIATRKDSIALDYFAGSGTTAHAVIALNRMDEGRRKFILAEAGEHFNTALLPRVKKVIYSPEWRDGKPLRKATAEEIERGPCLVKYQQIESYEDTLANIRFKSDGLDLEKITPRYELEWENRNSPARLSESDLEKPFSYTLELVRGNGENGQDARAKTADLPETFAYLIGLRVRTRRVETDGDCRYLIQRGISGGRETAVIWRNTAGWTSKDYERDRNFIQAGKFAEGADWILLNGDTILKQSVSLNPVFGEKMFAEEKKNEEGGEG